MSIKVAIADDHPLVISGVQHIIQYNPDILISETYCNGHELLEALQFGQVPDVLLLDIHMPGLTGDELAPLISEQYPSVKIIALTNQSDLYFVTKMLNSGVSGYILKTTGEQTLIEAIRAVHKGATYVENTIKEHLLKLEEASEIPNSIPALSSREKEILKCIVADLTSQEIADKLNISKRTVDGHRQNMLLKFGIKTSAGLAKKALALHLID